MTNQNNILTEEEIKEIIGNLNRNPNEAEIKAVTDYFWLRPYALQHLEDKKFRESFVRLIYMHHNALNWYIKADKEVKGLQSLTTNLEKEKNELLEKNNQLEANLEDKDKVIKNLEERVEIEQEEAEKAVQKAKEWRERQLTDLTGIKQDELFKNLEEKRENLFMELKNKEEELELVSIDLEDALCENETLKVENEKLKQELAENSKDLEDIKLENGEQKLEIIQLKGKLYYLFDNDKPLPEIKPLPSLPKRQNTFQKLGTKIKTKFQKLQQLSEKKKQQVQQFIARVEVNSLWGN
jgi:hypothetical protein